MCIYISYQQIVECMVYIKLVHLLNSKGYGGKASRFVC